MGLGGARDKETQAQKRRYELGVVREGGGGTGVKGKGEGEGMRKGKSEGKDRDKGKAKCKVMDKEKGMGMRNGTRATTEVALCWLLSPKSSECLILCCNVLLKPWDCSSGVALFFPSKISFWVRYRAQVRSLRKESSLRQG